jgi:signal transduction histidine kinase/DNA-binding NarL/FixJ family response regulator
MANKNNPSLILVVDDEINTTIMLQHIFEREGYKVEAANGGPAALRMAKALLPDLILLDILMPGMNGFEVLERLRDDPQTSKIPTVLITANVREPADIARGLNLGADDFLFKPFVPQELVARARSKIRAHHLEEALHRRTQETESLLRVSELLNQHFAVDDLLSLVLDMTFDLLPGDAAAIYQLNREGDSINYHVTGVNNPETAAAFDNPDVIERCLRAGEPVLWPPGTPLLDTFASGIGSVLQQGENRVGVLVLVSQTIQYDEGHLRLFKGLARQAALALNNAVLFAHQVRLNEDLEGLVAERTQQLQSAQGMLLRNEKLAAVGHLAASIAHEIGNPLTPISLLLNDLVEELEEQKVKIDFKEIELIQENVERIRRTLRLMLDFASHRKGTSEALPLNIAGLLQDVIALNFKAFQHAKINIESRLGDLPPIVGSKDQLQSVFMNLMINAQAAMPSGGTMRITARAKGEWIILEFSDTGTGITPENLDRIFDPFFTTKPNGTGLGLSVSYGIIKSHQGTIEVQSKIGKGTTFTIRLPVHQEAPESVPAG